MKRAFNNIVIKNKLILIIVTVSVIINILTLVYIGYNQIKNINTELEIEANISANLVSEYVAPALIFFDDYKLAKATLGKLETIPSVKFAILYNLEMKKIATYGVADSTKNYFEIAKVPDKVIALDDELILRKAVKHQNEKLGYLILGLTNDELYEKYNTLLITLVIVLSFAMLLSWLLATLLQRSISVPILKLAGHFNFISKEHRYDKIEFEERLDEIGVLQKGLNNMLEQIRSREREILNKEATLRKVIEEAPDAIFIFNRRGDITKTNKKTEEYLGYSVEELSEMNFFDMELIGNEKIDKLEIINSLEENNEFNREYGFKRKDGSIIYLDAKFTNLRIGRKQRILLFARDITETKKTYETIKLNEEKFRTIFNSSYDAFFIHEIDGTMIDVNDTMLKMYGVSREEALSYSVANDYSSDKNDLTKLATIWTNVSNGISQEIEWIAKQPKTGKEFYVQVNLSKIHYEGRDVILSNVRDISERKKFRSRIQALNKELEKKVIERTEQLEKTNKELEEFAYIVSHDLKAPLRAISKLSNWIANDYRDKLNEDGIEYLDLMQQRVERLNNLINGILTYSRLTRGERRDTEVDLNEIVDEIIDLLQIGNNFKIKKMNKLPTIKMDRTRAVQLFQNLITNSIKYNDKEEGLLEISSKEKEEEWEFVFQDNGPGIEPKYHEKVFKIFNTLKSRDEFESTGIGLSIVKKIVEIYGGNVRLISEKEKGAKFIFTIKKNLNG